MAGGSGERFWPLSRKLKPKQLLRLTSPVETLLEEAVNRIAPLVGPENVIIATAPHLAAPIREAGLVPMINVLAEPDKRNTLGCLAWIAAKLSALRTAGVEHVLPNGPAGSRENLRAFARDVMPAFAGERTSTPALAAVAREPQTSLT